MKVINKRIVAVADEYLGQEIMVRDAVEDAESIKIFTTDENVIEVSTLELRTLNRIITEFLRLKDELIDENS